MALNNEIANPIAAWTWLLSGIAGFGAWLAPKFRDLRRDLGFREMVMAKSDSPEESRVWRTVGAGFAYFGVWLGLYLILDWIF